MQITRTQFIDGKFSYRTINSEDIDSFDKAVNYIKTFGEEDYIEVRKEFFTKKASLCLKQTIILFIPYLSICCFIYYGFPGQLPEINNSIYNFISFLNIPIKSPKGWDFSYIIGIIFFFILMKLFLFDKINKVFMVRIATTNFFHYFYIYPLKLLSLLMILFLFFIAYISPDLNKNSMKKENCSGRHSLCFLRTEDMFFTSTFTCYLELGCATLGLFSQIFPLQPNGKKVKINWRKINEHS